MADEPISTLANKSVPAANSPFIQSAQKTSTNLLREPLMILHLGHLLAAASIVFATLLSATSGDGIGLLENQAQSIFFRVRGPITPPENIVILAIDDESISVPAQSYQLNPRLFAYLEPLKTFPFKRAVYAQVIHKLVLAGAKSVALDVVFAGPSPYGGADDRQFQEILQKYSNKVTLAATYENLQLSQGSISQLTLPQQIFQSTGVAIGSVNFPVDVDGKIHRLAEDFAPQLTAINKSTPKIPSFDAATLGIAKVQYPHPQGSLIYFWGPSGTFQKIPLWYLFDEENWRNYLNQGKFFQNKIVLVGSTATLTHNDHPVAASFNWLNPQQMSEVEIHAHAIASLIKNQTIALATPGAFWRSLFVSMLLIVTSLTVNLVQKHINRLISSIFLAGVWGVISYSCFIYFHLAFPTVIPLITITAIGIFYLIAEQVIREKNRKPELALLSETQSSLAILENTSVQNIESWSVKSKDLTLTDRILCQRYKIVKVLGHGGFSETYIAEDLQIPGQPQCVVKQLIPANTTLAGLELIRRLFNSEAQTLRKLGIHPQIPELLAYFEEDEEFYLVQEFIDGHPLSQEIPLGKTLSEEIVINILRDILETLVFVHENSVIHRDIKPGNIIRRHSDRKLVLIDFGAVKDLSTQQLENCEHSAFTIGMGTKGYAPNEQCFGRPQYNSDIYAVGMIGIKALTGRDPHDLDKSKNGEVKWLDLALVSPAVQRIINKMVLNDCRERYQSASEVLVAINQLARLEYSHTLAQPGGNLVIDDMDDTNIASYSKKSY